ncbi:MAG: DUF1214 domain-containing protein, partial [Methylocella sp.]
APAAARVLLSLIWGITTGCLSYAPKGKLPAGVCLIIIGTEGYTVPNKLNRYMLGSDTPKLKKNQDGSFTIYIQADDPEGDKESNWLPAPPGPFYLIPRAYAPTQQTINILSDPTSWPVPAVVEVK